MSSIERKVWKNADKITNKTEYGLRYRLYGTWSSIVAQLSTPNMNSELIELLKNVAKIKKNIEYRDVWSYEGYTKTLTCVLLEGVYVTPKNQIWHRII